MAIKINANFELNSQTPNFSRDQYATVAAMAAVTYIDDGHLAYCLDTKKTYRFESSNTVDAVTGKWRELQGIAIQRSVMPAASHEFVGVLCQYTGVTNANYKHSYWHECVEVSTGVYAWQVNEYLNTRVLTAEEIANIATLVAPDEPTRVDFANLKAYDLLIKAFIASARLTYQVVQALPETDIDTHTIYLKLDSEHSSSGQNIYEEWLYVKGIDDQYTWECIGTTMTTLDLYVLKTDAPGYNDILTKTLAATTYVSQAAAPGYNDILTKTLAATTYVSQAAAPGFNDILTKTLAAATYLAKTDAASTYVAKEDAPGYTDILTTAAAVLTYLSKTDAASTYVAKTDAPGYTDILTQANAALTYLTITTAGTTYLSKTDAADTYVKKADATGYADILTKTLAAATYLTKTDAASTYVAITADITTRDLDDLFDDTICPPVAPQPVQAQS